MGHRSTRIRRRRAALLLWVVALLIGACGDDSGDGTAGDPTTRPADTQAATTSTPPETTPPETTSGATATIPPPLEVAGTSWVPTEYTQSDGSITNTLGDEVSMVFGADGTLSGHNGCNEFEGTWEITGPYFDYDEGAEAFEGKIDGQPIAITAEVTTTVECEGFLADQDADFMAALNAIEIWYVGNLFGDETDGITLHGENATVWADPA